MALTKRTYVDGETIITAQNLNDIQDEIIAHESNKVPTTRTVNGKALSNNITITSEDIGLVLESTNDTTDRTSAIVAMLTNNKKCILGAGTFYTTGINMPDGSTLIGMGDATVLRKTGSGSYVINMSKNNVVESLCIDGNDTVSSTKGTHHGILWEGNFSTSHDSSLQPKNGKMSNITIKNCNGGGITCNDTGTGRDNNVLAINVAITNCNTGINIPYYSEYHKFTNIDVFDCYIGCLNNGGNNTFISCDFSNSKSKGFVIDNSNNDRNNNAHGSAIGCFFNHIANNSGTAIEIIKINNGFVFSGCQIFYGNIIITDSYGVEVTDSVFGSCSITITNGGGIVFAEDTFSVNPTVSITNNVFVYFRNCTNRSTGYYIPQTGQAVLTAGTQWNFPCVSGYLNNNVITLLIPITAETASTKDITTTSLITTLICADGTLLTNNEEDVSYINYVQLYSAGRGLAISLKKTNGWGTNLTRSTVSGQVKITTSDPIK